MIDGADPTKCIDDEGRGPNQPVEFLLYGIEDRRVVECEWNAWLLSLGIGAGASSGPIPSVAVQEEDDGQTRCEKKEDEEEEDYEKGKAKE
jgi:hypothetical protein